MRGAKRILVPIDGGERAETVVELVASLARGAGATVRLMHVSPVPPPRRDWRDRVVADAGREMARLAARAARAMQALEAVFEGVPVESVVRFGRLVDEIVLEAEVFGADLIAVADGARSGAGARLSGDLSEALARRAAARVMLIREAAA